jgi:hypothetical protein
MLKLLAGLTAVAVLGPWPWIGIANAADQDVSPRVSHARTHHNVAARECGECGCWYPEYVRHRDVVYQYPGDPRYTLTSEPFYVPGRVHTYAHNWF